MLLVDWSCVLLEGMWFPVCPAESLESTSLVVSDCSVPVHTLLLILGEGDLASFIGDWISDDLSSLFRETNCIPM